MNLIIIGAGPGGYETALLAAERGVNTVLIESGNVGGTCLNEGCIPTKSLCKNAEFVDQLQESENYGVGRIDFNLDFSTVQARKNAVVDQLRTGVETLLKNKLITLVRGRAIFKDSHTVMVTPEPDGNAPDHHSDNVEEPLEFTADYIIVATGSTSATLPIPGADLPGILTSKEILGIDHIPPRLCVIGGGVIGLEFASIFRSFGSEVTVVEYCKDILPRFDSDLAKRLRQSLGKRGIDIYTQSQVLSICQTEGAYQVTFSRKGKEETILADKVLMAVGRRPALNSLNFGDIGVETTPKGVKVNEFMQTSIPHIYAVGDIIGGVMLAHAATFQGVVALNHIMSIPERIDLSVMPAAVFTSPEAASVGMTEDECKERSIPVKCLKSFFRANGKAVTMGQTDGFCKIVVAAAAKDGSQQQYPEGKVLGCHLYGPHASDIVQEACALITQGAMIEDFRRIIHTHPTLTEILQSAVHLIS